MPYEITRFALALPLKLGAVNSYLVKTATGYLLIDTGAANQRDELASRLRDAGCQPGDLRLIVITHGDFDHTGNAAALRETFGGEIAMHAADVAMAERGDMFASRQKGNALLSAVSALLFGFTKARRFKPDLLLEERDTLAEHGLDARIVRLPGHSAGSIGILTAEGDLFCGDLLENEEHPAPGAIVDRPEALAASIEKLRGLPITTVYPGHGQPFAMTDLPLSKP